MAGATEEEDATLKIITTMITKKGVSTEVGVEDEVLERKEWKIAKITSVLNNQMWYLKRKRILNKILLQFHKASMVKK